MLIEKDFENIISKLETEIKKILPKGNVADYIPELSKINPDKFGVSISTIDGLHFGTGDFDENFSLQSIAKVFSLTMVYSALGEKIWNRVGVEPSGNPFNSLVQLEYEKGVPRNPFINAGALVICDYLFDIFENPEIELLNFVRKISGNSNINFNLKVAESESANGYRNKALINLMKSFGNINNDIDKILDLYFKMCSIEMSCKDLSHTFLLYSNHGELIQTGEKLLTVSQTKRLNSVMQTCGFYDESGEFTFKVGLPGKSGVGGGIAAIHPGKYSVAVWSPLLNEKGNSYLGMKILEFITTKFEKSIF
jgi:glutaminase